MKIFVPAPFSCRRQRGVASIAIAMLLMFIMAAAAIAVMNMSGSSVIDAAQNEEQVAARFLAESGVERAQATIISSDEVDSYTNATCTDLVSVTPHNLGRGSFQYTSASAFPELCGDSNSACTRCTVTVQGTIGSSSRSIRTEIGTSKTHGVAGYGTTFKLNLKSTALNSGAFTNLAYRAKDSAGGANANVSSCSNAIPGSSLTSCSRAWNLLGEGTGNVSGMGVNTSVPGIGRYTIDYLLSAPRYYALTGILLKPKSGAAVVNVGSYGMDTGNRKTSSTSGTVGRLPNDWNCGAPTNSTGSNGTASADRAAGSDTLLYGFSSLVASGTGELNGVSFGPTDLTIPQLYMRQIVTLSGDPDPNLNNKLLYSQIWFAYNPAYYSTGSTGVTSGAIFTGAVGGVVQGKISNAAGTASGNILTATTVTSGALRLGDTITGTGVSAGTQITFMSPTPGFTGTGANAGGTYGVSVSSTVLTNTALSAASNVLRVSAVTALSSTSSGVLTNQDTITIVINSILSYTTLSVTGATAGTGTTGDYLLSGLKQTLSGGAAISGSLSNGTNIAVFNATGTAPAPGTAIAVPVGAGVFDSAAVTGSISGTTLTVTNCSNGTPSVGDALFGKNVKSDTRITEPLLSGTACAGTYRVTPSQAAGSDPIVARAAVVIAASASSYTVSRKPTTRLTNSAQICGGVCAFFFGNAGSETNFNLSSVAAGPDWASGFACLRGVDPTQLVVLGNIVAKRAVWAEPVQ